MHYPTVILTFCVLGSAASAQPAPEIPELLIRGSEYAFETLSEVESGVLRVRLINEGESELHNAALMRLEDGYTLDDFSEHMRSSFVSPPWAIHIGGVESIPPGAEAEAIVLLEPGKHLIVCYHGEGQGHPHHALGMIATLDVAQSNATGAMPDYDVDLVMFDYGYIFNESLAAGLHTIRVLGAGPQIHNVLIWKLADGKTSGDLTRWLESDRSTPRPAQPMGGMTALSPGKHAYLPIEFEPGTYVLVCLVKDIDDHRFHLSHGMMKEFVVRPADIGMMRRNH